MAAPRRSAGIQSGLTWQVRRSSWVAGAAFVLDQERALCGQDRQAGNEHILLVAFESAVVADAIDALDPQFPTALVATGVLCDANCNIRVDLVLFFPILGLATFCAYQSYLGRPGEMKVVGTVLGVLGLFVFGLLAESYGYGDLAGVGFVVGALALGVLLSNRGPGPIGRDAHGEIGHCTRKFCDDGLGEL